MESVNKEARTLELSFSSEAPVERYDWWSGESYLEYLSHDEGEMDLERLNTVGVVGYNHDVRWELPIGSVERAWLDKDTRKCRATLRFDTDERADLIWQKIQSGTLRGVSFMYSVGVWEEVKAGKKSTCGRFTGPCYVGRQWEPFEVGPVAIPADPTVGAGRSAEVPPNDVSVAAEGRSEGDHAQDKETRGDNPMDEKEVQTVDVAAERAAAIESERARVTEITDMCRQFGKESKGYIEKGVSVEDVRKALIEDLAKERAAVSTVKVTKDGSDNLREAAIAGIGSRVALGEKVESGNPFKRMSLLRFAEECLERAGGSIPDSKDQLARDAVSMSPDFTAVMENIAHKKLMSGYDMAPTTFQLWTSKGSLSDFRAESRVLVSEFDDLEQVLPAQPYRLGKMSDQKVSISLGKYGKKFCLTWEDIINDNLGALSDIPMKQGAAAKRLINTTVYGLLNGNAAMSYDSVALFYATHGNLIASGGGAPSVTTLAATAALMRKQKNIGSKEPLNIAPAFLLVPVALEVAAMQLIGSIVDPAKSNATPNPFSNRLSVVSDPLLDATSTAVWYLAAAPGLVGTIEVAYLDGNEQPTFERRVGFDVDGIEFKVRSVFGAAVLDHKGLAKNPGQ